MPFLQFKGKSFVQNHHLAVPYHQLVPKKDKSLNNKVSLHDNLIIKGDNLLALKALLPTYAGKIKCIYIDPPYNTGNEEWKYNDNVNSPLIKEWLGKTVGIEGEDFVRHDKWLCMITPRLKLLKELLNDEGAIFISIDDNEIHNLRQIADEVFGSNNFVGCFIVNSAPNARDYGHIGKMHEYALFYAKDYEKLETSLIEDGEKRFNYSDDIGGYNIHPLYNSNVAFTKSNRPNLYYPFYLNPKKKTSDTFYEISLTKTEGAIEIFPPKSQKDNIQFVWRWGKEKSTKDLNKEIVGYKTSDGQYRVVQKMRTSSKLVRTILSDKSYTSRRGTAEVEEIFGEKTFTFPKPVELVKLFLKVSTSQNSIVLDSFAGSATTAQATLELNKEDDGNRKFILIECEKYADEITAERVRRVIKGVPNSKNELIRTGLGGTFSYFELGDPIETEGILKGDKLPSYLELARYVYYTATGEEFDESKLDESKNFVGASSHYDVYMLYKADIEYLKQTALTLNLARELREKAGNRPLLVFAPTKYVESGELDELKIDFCQLPFEIYKVTK